MESGETPHIRLATVHDLIGICRITNDSIRTSPANFHTDPQSHETVRGEWTESSARYPWVVAAVRNDIVGYAKASNWKPRHAYDWTAEVTCYVDPACQRQAIGTRLYQRLFQILERQGFRRLIAGITVPNDASIALHERLGFEHLGTLDDVGWKFDAWHSVSLWQRPLGSTQTPPTQLRPVAEAAGHDE